MRTDRYEHHTGALTVGDGVGDLRYLLLLKGLRDVYHIGGKAVLHGFIEIADGLYAHNLLPAVVLLEDVEHLVLPDKCSQPRRVFPVGDAKKYAVIILLYAEKIDKLGVGEQRTVVVIHIVVNLIICGVQLAALFRSFTLALSPFSSNIFMASSVGTT